jgi:hypothetical protein
MGTTPTNLTGIAGSAAAWRSQLSGQLATAGAPGKALSKALTDLADGCSAVVQAQATNAQTLADPTRTQQWKLDQVRTTMNDALAAATKAEQAYTAALASGLTQLKNSIMPGKPASFDPTLAAFYAGEYVKTLEQTSGTAARLKKVGDLLADAVAQRDSLKQYILSGDMLATTYDRLGLEGPLLYQTFAQVLAAGDATRTGPGYDLLPYLREGGSGTLAGLAVSARLAIYSAQQDWNAYLAQITRNYVLPR